VTELEFQELASQGYPRIPVLAEARADLYTPLALYAQHGHRMLQNFIEGRQA
jgi:hypothetical protein